MYSRLFCYDSSCENGGQKIQNILPLNMARAHAAAILDGLACPVHKVCKNSVFQQPSPVQRAFTFCTAAATRLPMGWSGTPTM